MASLPSANDLCDNPLSFDNLPPNFEYSSDGRRHTVSYKLPPDPIDRKSKKQKRSDPKTVYTILDASIGHGRNKALIIHNFYYDDDNYGHPRYVLDAIRAAVKPRTLGGFGMQLVKTLGEKLDAKSYKLEDAHIPVHNEKRTREYAAMRYGLSLAEYQKRTRHGYYGTFGFRPDDSVVTPTHGGITEMVADEILLTNAHF